MIEVKVDVDDLRHLSDDITVIEHAFAALMPGALNKAGDRMYSEVVTDIVQAFSTQKVHRRIGPTAVRNGLRVENANETIARYSVESVQPQFPYMRWITQRDERVCPICMPRDAMIFPDTIAWDLWFNRHPRCRCSITPVFLRDYLKPAGEAHILEAAEYAIEVFKQRFRTGLKRRRP